MFNYIACFDLDKTILNVNSAGLLIRQAHRNGLMDTKHLIYAYYLSVLYKLWPDDAVKIIERMAGWLKGISEEKIIILSNDIIKEFLLKAIRPEILAEISLHRERNARIVILSTSMFSICSPIAMHLGITEIICSRFELQDGIFTGRPDGRFCFGEEKLARLKEYCNRNNLNLEDAWYYADSFWDFPVLSSIGHPVCVTPDKKLRKIADASGWDIRDWL